MKKEMNVYEYLESVGYDDDDDVMVCKIAECDTWEENIDSIALISGVDWNNDVEEYLKEHYNTALQWGDEWISDDDGIAYCTNDYRSGNGFLIGDGCIIGACSDLTNFDYDDFIEAWEREFDGNLFQPIYNAWKIMPIAEYMIANYHGHKVKVGSGPECRQIVEDMAKRWESSDYIFLHLNDVLYIFKEA